MNKKVILLSFTTGLLFVSGIFANDSKRDEDNLDISSIVYIEDDMEVELGFDTSDYLPEGFNAHEFYFDFAGVSYLEDDVIIDLDTKQYLPKGFDAYAYPSDVQSINYIDVVEDAPIELGFDTSDYLPSGFNAFSK
ncbi:hypothetical protein HPE56_06060 [Maribacter sp. ANRC-HE7]|uniref:Uncharacterized protein n=1 Tax=Maribacter aquimaris TaxID=2737171 RepID=A0ABR7V0B4_9FLAO|nr:hypothetical protein [Maribacter aquimaris]MBD0777349.1 hypothetical protein [Maribacter aquimaris]